MTTTDGRVAPPALPTAKGRRRKWGWIFLILFVVQAVVFGAMIGGLHADATGYADLARDALKNPTSSSISSSQSWAMDAQYKRSSARSLTVLCIITSIITLVLGFIGTRRRKAQQPAPST